MHHNDVPTITTNCKTNSLIMAQILTNRKVYRQHHARQHWPDDIQLGSVHQINSSNEKSERTTDGKTCGSAPDINAQRNNTFYMTYIFRQHCSTVCMQMWPIVVVCLSVCRSLCHNYDSSALPRRLNQSRYCLVCTLGWAKGIMY